MRQDKRPARRTIQLELRLIHELAQLAKTEANDSRPAHGKSLDNFAAQRTVREWRARATAGTKVTGDDLVLPAKK